MPRYTVTLSAEERDKLKALCSKGTTPTKVFVHARALLLCDQGEFAEHKWDLKRIAQALGITDRTLNNLKVRFITQGLEATLQRKPYSAATASLMRLLRTSCWRYIIVTCQLARANGPAQAVAQGLIAAISRTSVHKILQKHGVKLS